MRFYDPGGDLRMYVNRQPSQTEAQKTVTASSPSQTKVLNTVTASRPSQI